ncbi:2579_t:CDS:1, partial [Ambispora gerdemannii]
EPSVPKKVDRTEIGTVGQFWLGPSPILLADQRSIFQGSIQFLVVEYTS